MIELAIPQPGEDARQVKDVVFTILSHEQPLSIIEVFRRIKKQHNLGITYQAVRKSINALESQGVLRKEEKRYRISKDWVLKLKGFFDNLLATYETGKRVHAFNQALLKEDYAVYTFNSLLDLDNFWNDIISHWASNLKKGDNPIFFSHYNYGFWFLINLGKETRLYERVIAQGGRPHMVILQDAPLNRWGMKLYEETGARIRMLKGHDLDEATDLNLLGNTILQVKYPKDIVKKMRTIFEKHHSTQDLSLREIARLAHKPCEIKIVLFKNPVIARGLWEKYKPLFE